MRVEQLCATEFARSHPGEASRRLERMPADASAAFLQTLERDVAAVILASMHTSSAARCLAGLPSDFARAMLAGIPSDRAARLLLALPEAEGDALLAASPPALRDKIARVRRYPPGSAGALMDPAPFAVSEDVTVAEAQRELRRAGGQVFYYIYVVARDHRLVGVLDLRELLASDSAASVRSAMRTDLQSLSPLTDMDIVATHPAWNAVDALPVLGRDGELLGVLRHRTLRQAVPTGGGIRVEQVGATITRLSEIYWATLGTLVVTLAAVTAPKQASIPSAGRTDA